MIPKIVRGEHAVLVHVLGILQLGYNYHEIQQVVSELIVEFNDDWNIYDRNTHWHAWQSFEKHNPIRKRCMVIFFCPWHMVATST